MSVHLISHSAGAERAQLGPVERACPACRSTGLTTFAELGEMPAQVGVSYATSEAARNCERGEIRLAFCPACSFITNSAFSARVVDYDHPYDNDLDHSDVYRQYEQGLVERLIESHALRGKRVLEIGCGRGGFLKRICSVGENHGIGYDPSLRQSAPYADPRIEFVPDYYPGSGPARQADLIVCRQVFEHVADPLGFLTGLRATIRDGAGTAVFFEVPNFGYVLDELAFWTVIYEHCSYFTRESLESVFRKAGFAVQRAYDCFDGQFLGIEATAVAEDAAAPATDLTGSCIAERIDSFIERLNEKLCQWQAQLADLGAARRRAVIWGAGARAVCFLNLAKGSDCFKYVTDINPNKVGNYIPGTGQQIVDPAFLTEYRPEVIVVMNDIYRDEIARRLEALGIKAQLLFA